MSMIPYPCGCLNETHVPTGVLRSVHKCDLHRKHQRRPEGLDEAYYAELGVIKNGQPTVTNHLAELAEALGPIPRAPYADAAALEVGCGPSPYVGAIVAAGYRYVGLEPSVWAAEWMRTTWNVPVVGARFEVADLPHGHFSLVLAAHSIEHVPDAPAAIARCAAILAPGGELRIVVPDDCDPVNPDHLWTFDERTLRVCVAAAGLAVEAFAVRRYVDRENFLYCRARKP